MIVSSPLLFWTVNTIQPIGQTSVNSSEKFASLHQSREIAYAKSVPIWNLFYEPNLITDEDIFTGKELEHLSDIYDRLTWVIIIWLFSFGAVYVIDRTHLELMHIGVVRFFGALFIALAALLLYSILHWNKVFTTFHELIFISGTWQFPRGSLLLTIFPELYWKVYGGSTLITFCLVIALTGLRVKERTRENHRHL